MVPTGEVLGGPAVVAARRPSSPSSRRLFGAAVGVVGAVALLLALGVVSKTSSAGVIQVVLVGATLFASAAAARAALRSTGRLRFVWSLAAGTIVLQVTGDILSLVLSAWYGNLPSPSLIDAIFILSYPLWIACVLSFPSAPARHATRWRALLDGASIAVALFWVSWAMGLGTLHQHSSAGPLARAASLSYPFGDVLVATALLIATSRSTRSMRGPLLLALLGLALNVVGDSANAFLNASGPVPAQVNDLILSLFAVGFATFGLAALHPSASVQPAIGEGPTGLARVSLPFISILVVGVTAGAMIASGRKLDPFLVYPGCALLLLLMANQVLTYMDSLSLLAQSQAAEARVEKLSRAKSEMMSMVSHEFRNGLVGIQGFSELLMDDGLPETDVRSFATDIHSDAVRLPRMITEMLDLDRMEAAASAST